MLSSVDRKYVSRAQKGKKRRLPDLDQRDVYAEGFCRFFSFFISVFSDGICRTGDPRGTDMLFLRAVRGEGPDKEASGEVYAVCGETVQELTKA